MTIDTRAAEIFGQLKNLKICQENDCNKPIKIPINGEKRAILLNLGLINGH